MPPETLEKIQNYIANTNWRFAKTMPQWPHWYTVRNWKPDLAGEMLAFAEAIFKYGYDVKFGNKTYRYLNIGDYKYWSMDPTPQSTDLINRARLDGKSIDDNGNR